MSIEKSPNNLESGALPEEKMIEKVRLFVVHRTDFEKRTGATQHHFSDPLPEEQARELEQRWRNINALPRKGSNPVERIEVSVEPFKPVPNYDDNKLRKITHEGGEYQWKSDGQTVIIYKNGESVYAFTGDPHDRTRSGVIRVIKEENL